MVSSLHHPPHSNKIDTSSIGIFLQSYASIFLFPHTLDYVSREGLQEMMTFFLILISCFFVGFAIVLLGGNRIAEGIEYRTGKDADEMLGEIDKKMNK